MKEVKKKQNRYDNAYMRMAEEWAKLSHCTRKNVGALIVKDGMIIADGYNGSPSGFPNVCENEDGKRFGMFCTLKQMPLRSSRNLTIAQKGQLFI